MTDFLRLDRLAKRFGSAAAVDGLSLTITRGEILALLGPSGSGKTTTLRLLAGFETPDGGSVIVEGVDVTRQPPVARRFGMVFQHYALFPHLDVGENVGFGLESMGVRDAELAHRVARALELVELAGFERRRIAHLSGGQQQRVALARALAPEPRVLLLDEPLSNLDPVLRERTRRELHDLIHLIGITTVLVTHEQEEAFELGDRVAVLREGRLEQVGTPDDLYGQPANPFVAAFVGRASMLEGVVVEQGGRGDPNSGRGRGLGRSCRRRGAGGTGAGTASPGPGTARGAVAGAARAWCPWGDRPGASFCRRDVVVPGPDRSRHGHRSEWLRPSGDRRRTGGAGSDPPGRGGQRNPSVSARGGDMTRSGARPAQLLALALLALILWLVAYPLVLVLLEAVHTAHGWTLDYVRQFAGRPTEWHALWGSCWIAVASVALSGSIGVPLAVLVTRYEFPGRRALTTIVALPAVLPPLVGVVAFLFLYGESGFLARAVQALLRLDEAPWRLEGPAAILLVHAYSMYV